MVTVRVTVQALHCQIDDFGSEVERSSKGSLHFHPNSIKSITDSEWEHIQEEHPDLAAGLQVITPVVKPAKKAIKLPTPSEIVKLVKKAEEVSLPSTKAIEQPVRSPAPVYSPAVVVKESLSPEVKGDKSRLFPKRKKDKKK